MIPIAQPLLGREEEGAVLEVLRSGQLAQGPRVEAFERSFAEWLGVKYAVATSSGTAALHIALLAHGIGPGDEVITSPFTFIASANAILFCGARPVFVDIEPDTYNINPMLIEEAITSRTKAIMPVHIFGNPCDMQTIMAVARRHKLVVIEDACQAHGAEVNSQRVGTFGTGCFSFYPTKNMTTGEGGMVTTDDPDLADRLRLLRNHGQRRRYYHEAVGYNFRMTEIQAAIGLVQLGKLDSFNERRIANAAYLDRHLQGVVKPVVRPGHRHVYHQYTIRVPAPRERWIQGLAERGVGTMIYYPLPVHKQRVYLEMGYEGSFPVAEQASAEVLSLPVHPALTSDDLATIVRAVEELL